MFRSEKPKMVDFRSDYATRADFCEVLERELNSLYLLAFLLTANHKEAERCFTTTVQEALEEHSVFKDWAPSWVKRSIIKNAIGIVSAASGRSTEKRDLWTLELSERRLSERNSDDEINAVTQLSPFERFVFVMSVLEHYSAWECSILLGCSAQKVVQFRTQALRALTRPVALFPPVEAPFPRAMESLA
jgi:DNA-directed RNA polymerase specialized sigma24 family protein